MENEVNQEEIARELIDEILRRNEITQKELCENEDLIYLVIKKLKDENKISYRIIENLIKVNRKRLRRIEQKREKG